MTVYFICLNFSYTSLKHIRETNNCQNEKWSYLSTVEKKRANEKYWPNDFQKTKIREKIEAKKKEKVHRINTC